MGFPNSPISEAIFDIRVILPDETNLDNIAILYEDIKNSFPNKQIRRNVQTKLNFDVLKANISDPIESSIRDDGFFFISDDNKKIVQARLDGFTFSKIKPYHTWKSFCEEAYQLWHLYINIAQPQKINRLALRYINRIEIPFEGLFELKDYLRTVPEIPEDLAVVLRGHFMQLVVSHKDYEPSVGIISQSFEQTSQQNILPIIFDIDVFQEVSLNPRENDDEVKRIFEENLRNFRTAIFFKSITKKTEDLFQ